MRTVRKFAQISKRETRHSRWKTRRGRRENRIESRPRPIPLGKANRGHSEVHQPVPALSRRKKLSSQSVLRCKKLFRPAEQAMPTLSREGLSDEAFRISNLFDGCRFGYQSGSK